MLNVLVVTLTFAAAFAFSRPVAGFAAGLALALSPWPVLTALALGPLFASSFMQSEKRRSAWLALGWLLATVGSLGVAAAFGILPANLIFSTDRVLSVFVVDNAFNIFSLLGLNQQIVSGFWPWIASSMGLVAFVVLGRPTNPLVTGAFLSLAASLLLPGQTIAASAAGLGVMLVAAGRNAAWWRFTTVLAMTLFVEVYLATRVGRYSALFARDWDFDPSRAVTPTLVAIVLIKVWILYKIYTTPVTAHAVPSAKGRTWLAKCELLTAGLVKTPRVSAKDAIWIAILTLVSFGLTFYRLGTTEQPQSFVQGSVSSRLTLPSDQIMAEMWIHKSRDAADVTITCADQDAKQSVKFGKIESHGWAYRRLVKPCRGAAILEVNVASPGHVSELYFADGKGNHVRPAEICSPSGEQCGAMPTNRLFDESHLIRGGIPTHWHGAYYDEAFHIDDGIKLRAGSGSDFTPAAHPFFGRATIALAIKSLGAFPLAWRLPDAVSGALLPLLALVLAWRLFGRKDIAYAAGFFVLFDLSRLSLSRVATTDSQLSFWILLQALALWEWWRTTRESPEKVNNLATFWLVVVGLSLGAAAGIKWSGLFTTPIIAATLTIAFIRRARQEKTFGSFPLTARYLLAPSMTIGIAALAMYLASYAFLLQRVDASLVATVMDDAVRMLNFHQTFSSYVPYQSQFVEWPWINRPVALFAGYGLPADLDQRIFIMGHPFLWWAILPAIYAGTGDQRLKTHFGFWYIFSIFVTTYVAWAFIGRQTYLYHFAPIAPFGLIALAAYYHNACSLGPALRRAYATAVVAGFVIFLPIALGTIVPAEYFAWVEWFPEWFGLFDPNKYFQVP